MASLKKNFLYNAILTVFNSILPAISFPYVSRILLADGIGKAQFAFSLAQYFVIFASLGIPIYGIREIARNRKNKEKLSAVFWEIFIINVAATVLISILYILLIYCNNTFLQDLPVYLAVSPLVFLSFLNIDWFFSGLEKFKQIAFRSISIKLLSLLGIFLLVKKPADLPVYLVIMVLSALLNQVWNWVLIRKEICRAKSPLSFRPHIKPIFITFGVLLAVSLYTVFDTVLLGILADSSSVGYYSASVRLNRLIIPVITALGVVLTPRLSLAMEENDEQQVQMLIDKSFWGICFLAIPASIGLYLFAEEIIYVFAGPNFAGAVMALRLMSPLALIVGLAHLFSTQVLIPGKRENLYLVAVVIGCIFCVTFNLILVPTFRSNGAAAVNTLTELIISSFSLYFMMRYFHIRIHWKILAIRLVYTILLFYSIYFLVGRCFPQPLYRLLTGIPLCAFSYLVFGMYIEKDKMLLLLFHEYYQKIRQ